jgi:hypothetical protein
VPAADWERNDSTGFAASALPTGISIYPKEMYRTSRRWAEQKYSRLIHFNELAHGGHFAAYEEPESFVDEMRVCFRSLRG